MISGTIQSTLLTRVAGLSRGLAMADLVDAHKANTRAKCRIQNHRHASEGDGIVTQLPNCNARMV